MSGLRIAFIRQIFGSEWAQRSHTCIRRGFPDAPIIELPGTPPKIWTRFVKPLLDQCHLRGRLRSYPNPTNPAISRVNSTSSLDRTLNPVWLLRQYLSRRYAFDALRPVVHGLNLQVDYLVHIDEDCFLTDGSQLQELVEYMDSHPEILIAGPADGGTPFREIRNPYACNLFFNVIKREPMSRLIRENPDWRHLRFRDLPRDVVEELPARRTVLRPVDCDEPYCMDDYEPYYPLYWLTLKAGFAIHYLPVSLTNDDRRSSAIRLSGASSDLCFHMWYMREWVAGNDLMVYGVPNPQRYECARRILEAYGIS